LRIKADRLSHSEKTGDDGAHDVYYAKIAIGGWAVTGGEMNRRDFGKTALAVTVTAMAAPAALASTPHSVTDCIVIDFGKSQQRWVHLRTPDEKGRHFAYQETGEMVTYRHFEFLRDDGLVVGQSTTMAYWTQTYDTLENSFLAMRMPAGSKGFTPEEFRKYVDEVRIDLNGWIVPLTELGNS
jgi:hypothetical protein